MILPLTVLRRLDCVLEPTKSEVLETMADLPETLRNREPLLQQVAGQPFVNMSRHTFHTLLGDPVNVAGNLRNYIAGFSESARDIVDKFNFDVQIDRLDDHNLLYLVVSKFAEVDLSPTAVSNLEMGYLYEELIRKFSELSNETAGEHFTPREVIRLMVNLLFADDDELLTRPGVVKTLLDPACGTGNFLYLALQALKDLEHRVQFEAEALGFQRAFPEVGPANVKGIEINPYAAELARVSVWIGEIQWMRRNGFAESRNPILKPLDTIERRDAILTPDNTEPDWPEADVVIGNPPFLGGKLLIANLGEDYVSRMFATYAGRVPAEADLVCYWFEKAGQQIASGKAKRAGLVATNSIRGGANLRALQAATSNRPIFEAWSDEPWVIDGAAVRVSLVCFSRAGDDSVAGSRLDGAPVDEIYADLTARRDGVGVDLTKARRLAENAGVAFMGDTKGGPFDIAGDLAREWLRLPANPNGRTNADVLKPWINGMDLTRRPAGKWIVDFGLTMPAGEAALYEEPFRWTTEHVRPTWDKQREAQRRDAWWLHHRPRPHMRAALDGLSRYIATPTVAKHRLFVWCDARICPDHQLIVIARDDDTTFGILHSRFHEIWSLRLGTWLGKGNDPRYTPTSTFATFPFPTGLAPDVPTTEHASDPRAAAVATAAHRLVELRDRWLNPPEWVAWIDEPVSGYPKRPVPRDENAANALKKRTLTNLYNARPQWLTDAHEALDEAVAAAYGWPADISDDDVLRELLALNGG